MAVLRKDEVQGLEAYDFGDPRAKAPEARPAEFEDVTPRREPPAPAEPAPPPPPPVPPTLEIPEDLLAAFYQDVLERGREEGRAQVLAELGALRERYAAALDRLEAVSRQLVDRNRVQVIALACRVAERLVRHHLSEHPEHLLALVREAMAELDERDEVVVHCSPDDYAFLTARRPELCQGLGESFRVQVVADDGLEPGDFRVEARTGTVDGRVGPRLAEAQEALLGPDEESPDAD